jgi:hypothetical protein
MTSPFCISCYVSNLETGGSESSAMKACAAYKIEAMFYHADNIKLQGMILW